MPETNEKDGVNRIPVGGQFHRFRKIIFGAVKGIRRGYYIGNRGRLWQKDEKNRCGRLRVSEIKFVKFLWCFGE